MQGGFFLGKYREKYLTNRENGVLIAAMTIVCILGKLLREFGDVTTNLRIRIQALNRG